MPAALERISESAGTPAETGLMRIALFFVVQRQDERLFVSLSAKQELLRRGLVGLALPICSSFPTLSCCFCGFSFPQMENSLRKYRQMIVCGP